MKNARFLPAEKMFKRIKRERLLIVLFPVFIDFTHDVPVWWKSRRCKKEVVKKKNTLSEVDCVYPRKVQELTVSLSYKRARNPAD